ncbi:NACHT domain-containing NTPase [Reinekea sp. G2M2-21]|uniref:NACHT domain-containing protein n=1 Tax=Reinekea sp. G2M2-21 TaxID=2788942 RepID=UPI0018AAE0AF|nr:hypothetical protein [Reinekea sp. G2M2-21]
MNIQPIADTLYLPRTLRKQDNSEIPESEVRHFLGPCLILSEPGAGKSALALQWKSQGASYFTATQLYYKPTPTHGDWVVIDGLDELGQENSTELKNLIAKASEIGAKTIIFTCRANVWHQGLSKHTEQMFNTEVNQFSLQPLSDEEQHHWVRTSHPNIDTAQFFELAKLSGIGPMLGNPLYLDLICEAFQEKPESFNSKLEIFQTAINKRSLGRGDDGTSRYQAPAEQFQLAMGQLAACLLIAGASGVVLEERHSTTDYPYIQTFPLANAELTWDRVFSVALFDHRPYQSKVVFSHRTFAEYLAAKYLVNVINDAASPISLKRIMALIAPNDILRTDLRGLAGWMTALASPEDQNVLIQLDPVAILSNADASGLAQTQKAALLNALQTLTVADPYFRYGQDFRDVLIYPWLDAQNLPHVTPLLQSTEVNDGLKQFMLEGLTSSIVDDQTCKVLSALALDSQSARQTRELALELLHRNPLDARIDLTKKLFKENVDPTFFLTYVWLSDNSDLLQVPELQQLVFEIIPLQHEKMKVEFVSKYWLTKCVELIPVDAMKRELDRLSETLEQSVLQGIPATDSNVNATSRIVSLYVDQLFEHEKPDQAELTRWLQFTEFGYQDSGLHNRTVEYFRENNQQRQSIQYQILVDAKDEEHLWKNKRRLHQGHIHKGLTLTSLDQLALCQLSFEDNRTDIWKLFLYSPGRELNNNETFLRRSQRSHALQKEAFMAAWVTHQRQWKRWRKTDPFQKRERRYRRHHKKLETKLLENNAKLKQRFEDKIRENPRGEHWDILVLIARYELWRESKQEHFDISSDLVNTTLQYGIDEIISRLPDWSSYLKGLRNSNRLVSVYLLQLCALRYPEFLPDPSSLSENTLKVLWRTSRTYMDDVDPEDQTVLTTKCLAVLNKKGCDLVQLVVDVIQPQLSNSKDNNTWLPDLDWLCQQQLLQPIMSHQLLTWLENHALGAIEPVSQLFEAALKYANRDRLRELTEAVCTQNPQNQFWLLRASLLTEHPSQTIWQLVTSQPENLFFYHSIYNRLHRLDISGWPKLSANSVKELLLGFAPLWPKVHLPSHWGTDSPKEQTAYRFLRDLTWKLNEHEPMDRIRACEELLQSPLMHDYSADLRSILYNARRSLCSVDSAELTAVEVSDYFRNQSIPSVSALREIVLEELAALQGDLEGGDLDLWHQFYNSIKEGHVTTYKPRIENECNQVVAERLRQRLRHLGCTAVTEKYYANEKRADISVERQRGQTSFLLPMEAKRQMHPDLFSAAQGQLDAQYLIHPNSDSQGIFLVYWFGKSQDVANRKNHSFLTAKELKEEVEARIPDSHRKLISVVVLTIPNGSDKIR